MLAQRVVSTFQAIGLQRPLLRRWWASLSTASRCTSVRLGSAESWRPHGAGFSRAMSTDQFANGSVVTPSEYGSQGIHGSYDADTKPAEPAQASHPETGAANEEIDPEVRRSEVNDAEIIFQTAWKNLEMRHGRENMVFPKEIIWLAGAPGAGKGTMTPYIMKERDLQDGPIEVSKLLKGERFQKLKDEGQLIGDRDVVESVFEELLNPKYSPGVIVDGFPRTRIQAECIKLLHEYIRQLCQEFRDHPVLKNRFRRPIFRITVLYIEEDESVRRQLHRAKLLEKHNRRARDTGYGQLQKARATDTSEELARQRYRVFQKEVYDALQVVKGQFHFHFVPADGPVDEVRQRIVEEFAYQSSLELGDDTYEQVRRMMPAQHVIRNARQRMVQRLNSYVRDHLELFESVIQLLETEFQHILQRQALAGRAIIRSDNPILASPIAINMTLDVLAERGYFVTLDVRQEQVPWLVEPSTPGDTSGQRIMCKVERHYIFTVEFPRPIIRRGG